MMHSDQNYALMLLIIFLKYFRIMYFQPVINFLFSHAAIFNSLQAQIAQMVVEFFSDRFYFVGAFFRKRIDQVFANMFPAISGYVVKKYVKNISHQPYHPKRKSCG